MHHPGSSSDAPVPRRRFFAPKPPEALYSEANIITLIRLVVSLGFFILAILRQSQLYNYIGLTVHLVGDAIDGWCARGFKQETLLGAEIDIIADRVESLFFFVNFIHFHPGLAIPSIVYILNFAFVDFYLSYQFVKYDIISINYFYKVDQRVFALNFSPPAKFVNSTVVVLMLIFLPKLWIATTILAAGLIVVKLHSIGRLWRKRRETASGPAVPAAV